MIIQEDAPVELATPSGPMRTYMYRPVAPGRYPGLVFFSEIFQRTAPIKRTAALLAGHGFVVAVPEVLTRNLTIEDVGDQFGVPSSRRGAK